MFQYGAEDIFVQGDSWCLQEAGLLKPAHPANFAESTERPSILCAIQANATCI